MFVCLLLNRPDPWQIETAVTQMVRPSTVKSQKGVGVPLCAKELYGNMFAVFVFAIIKKMLTSWYSSVGCGIALYCGHFAD